LLEESVELEFNDGDSGRTSLWYALENRHEAIVKLLLDKGADVASKNRSGQTLLWYALKNGHNTIVKLLLDKGANVASKDRDCGRSPLS
jgi:ankyrin repeat protein